MNLAAESQFPSKWPFPPAPPARRAWARVLTPLLSPFRHGRRYTQGGGGFAATQPASTANTGMADQALVSAPAGAAVGSIASAAVFAADRDVTVRQMVVDILLVAMWGAMIPALMWLGAAAGF
ncbi:hypothetical protein [Bordetella sp. H567]|uniref:hypothetical protein n=1 Tax=Bordetella sp. H567 TaxID=1697043 RepID=UPI000829847B|nr:hypothetical protein [Bordetella sp. H567]